MGSRITVNGKELKDRIKMLLSFFTPSKIYYYGNYTQVKLANNTLFFTQVQIVGEAVNTGLLEVKVPMPEPGLSDPTTDTEIMVPAEELKKIVNQIPEDYVTVILEPKKLTILSLDKEITIPVVESEIPLKLKENHALVSQAPLVPFDIKKINSAIAEVNYATKGVIVSYDNHAIYLDNEKVIVNKGVRITVHFPTEPLGFTESLYLPIYMIPVLKHLEDENVSLGRVTTAQQEDLAVIKGDFFTIHFQEWYSKREFPLETINLLTQFTPTADTPEYLSTLKDISTADTVIRINLSEGQISTRDNKIVVEVPTLNRPTVYINTEIMPKKAELNKYTSVIVGSNAVKFQGENIITIVATMEER